MIRFKWDMFMVVFCTVLCIVFAVLLLNGNVILNFDKKGVSNVSSLNSLSESGYGLVLSDGVLRDLESWYSSEYEYGVCLSGGLKDYVFNVTGTQGYVLGNNYSVSSCGDWTGLGSLHNHPNGICRASNSDILSWKAKINKGQTLFIIQCAKDKFVVYTQERLNEGYIYEK